MILNLILSLVLKFGLHYVLAFLKEKLPWLPLPDGMQAILTKFIEDVRANKANHADLHDQAKRDLSACMGIGCPSDLKTIREEENQ